jgi:hypothetical protein
MGQAGTHCFVVPMKRVMTVEGRGQVTGVGIDRSTGNGRNRLVLAEGGSLHSVARAG